MRRTSYIVAIIVFLSGCGIDSSNPADRLGAIRETSATTVLLRVAKTDTDADVTLAAIERLIDQDALEEVITERMEHEPKDDWFRREIVKAAATKLTDPDRVNRVARRWYGYWDGEFIETLATRITDQEILARVARDSHVAVDVRVSATRRLFDQQTLESLVNATERGVGYAAECRLRSTPLLESVAKRQDNVGRIAVLLLALRNPVIVRNAGELTLEVAVQTASQNYGPGLYYYKGMPIYTRKKESVGISVVDGTGHALFEKKSKIPSMPEKFSYNEKEQPLPFDYWEDPIDMFAPLEAVLSANAFSQTDLGDLAVSSDIPPLKDAAYSVLTDVGQLERVAMLSGDSFLDRDIPGKATRRIKDATVLKRLAIHSANAYARRMAAIGLSEPSDLVEIWRTSTDEDVKRLLARTIYASPAAQALLRQNQAAGTRPSTQIAPKTGN
jgi:hypothetical protein